MKITKVLGVLAICASVLLLYGCPNSDSKPNPVGEKPVTKKSNCIQEFQQLSSQGFNSIAEARAAVQKFTKDYNDVKECEECWQKAYSELLGELTEMDLFFQSVEQNSPAYRYISFMKKEREEGRNFSGSSYGIVRDTWKNVYTEKKDEYLDQRMASITGNSFKNDFIEYAKEVCNNTWAGGALDGWHAEGDCYIVNNNVGNPTTVDRTSKRTQCVVNVHMKGNGPAKTRNGDVRVWVEGTIQMSDDGEFHFAKGDYCVESLSGGIARREGKAKMCS